MKKVKCPQCGRYVEFDDSERSLDNIVRLQCPSCGKRFGLRLKKAKTIDKTPSINNNEKNNDNDDSREPSVGHLHVIENAFHYAQDIDLHLGRNTIGRRMKGNDIDCPIATDDTGIDLNHCSINVEKRQGKLVYTISDGPSYGGTFVGNDRLQPRERRRINPGELINIGGSTMMLCSDE